MMTLGTNHWTLNRFSFILLWWMARNILNECSYSAYYMVSFMVMLSRNNTVFPPRSLDRVVSIIYQSKKGAPSSPNGMRSQWKRPSGVTNPKVFWCTLLLLHCGILLLSRVRLIQYCIWTSTLVLSDLRSDTPIVWLLHSALWNLHISNSSGRFGLHQQGLGPLYI